MAGAFDKDTIKPVVPTPTTKKGLTPEQIAAETAKQVAAGIKSTSKAAKLEGETYAQANARLTEAYKAQPKPELTVEGKAAGATIEWVRTSSGGIGAYKEVFPMGAAIPDARTTNYGNVYDKNGNLIAGTGLKTGVPGTKSVVSTVKNPDGTTTITYSDGTTTVLPKTPDVFNPKVVTSTVKNADGTTTIKYSDGTTEVKAATAVVGDTEVTEIGKPTTNIDVLKASLKGLGFSAAIIDASSSFLNGLLKDGLDYDNATEIFLNSKEYTLKTGAKITSPFYTEYGYLNEGLTVPKTASEIFNTVEGFKGVIDKYKLSTKYLTPENMQKYFKNDVTVKDLAERAATAQLRAVEADPFQVNALIKQGFIGSQLDLTDFYMDSKIGQEQLELNRQTGVFTAEALRRAKTGVVTSDAQLAGFKKLTASLAAKGYSEAQISQLASTGFENVAQTLEPLVKYAGIYQKAGGTKEANAALAEDLQTGLLAEEFQGTASERRKRLSEQNVRAFQGTAGTTAGSLRTSSTLGII